jgi:hypothetical protein
MVKPQSVGLCGEHYAAAFMAGFGLAVAVPRGGAARDDLFVADEDRGRPVRVQVKTARDPYGKYKGDEICSWDCAVIEAHDESRWFAFVALNGWPERTTMPTIYFVPSAEVAKRMVDEKGKSRTFFWMKIADAEKFSNKSGLDLLTAVFAQPCQAPPVLADPPSG